MNTYIIDKLKVLLQDKIVKGEPFKIKAYKNAIKAIETHEEEIKNPSDLKKVKNLVRGSIYKKIEELLNTGTIGELHKLSNTNDAMAELQTIYGIGPKTAKKFIDKGIDSIEKLEENKSLLNEKQKDGLKFHKDLKKRIPRNEMIKHEKFVTNLLKDLTCNVVGSYRRGESSSGDIDVMCTTENNDITIFTKILDKLVKLDYIKKTLAHGKKKFMGICKLPEENTHRRIDIIYCSKVHYGFMMMYFTGSARFNVDFRNHALSKGYSMNEYGMKKKGEIVHETHDLETERDIFKFFGVKYIEPCDRKGGILKNYLE